MKVPTYGNKRRKPHRDGVSPIKYVERNFHKWLAHEDLDCAAKSIKLETIIIDLTDLSISLTYYGYVNSISLSTLVRVSE